MTPMKAIRAKCLDCCCGSSVEVKLCPATDCPLFVYRFGHRPRIDSNAENADVAPHENDSDGEEV